jgi:hypothetical protein
MKSKPAARLHEGARDPARLESKNSAARTEGVLNLGSADHVISKAGTRAEARGLPKTADDIVASPPISSAEALARECFGMSNEAAGHAS